MKLYRCVYQMGVETALEYRANMVLTLLSTIFPIIIQTFLWNYLYGNGDAGEMTGYSYTEIIVYTLLAGFFFYSCKCAVYNLLCNASLTIQHNVIDQLGYNLVVV